MKVTLDMKNGRAIFKKIQERNVRANLCEK